MELKMKSLLQFISVTMMFVWLLVYAAIGVGIIWIVLHFAIKYW